MQLLGAVELYHFGQTYDISLGWIGAIIQWLVAGIGIVGVGIIVFSLILKLIVLLIITKIGARCRTLRANFVFASALEKTANVRMRLHLRLVARCARSAFAHSLRDDFPCLLRKEVIQPLVPQRLPCYDFIPITTHTLGRRSAGLRVQTAFMM